MVQRESLSYTKLRAHETAQAEKHRAATLTLAAFTPAEKDIVTKKGEVLYQTVSAGLLQYDATFHPPEGSLYNNLLVRATHSSLPVQVLDVGCGTGQFLRDIARRAITDGVAEKVSLTGISVGDGRKITEKEFDATQQFNFVDADIQSMQLNAETYDLIVARWSIKHLTDPLRIIKKLYRSLRVGGELYVHLEKSDLIGLFAEYTKEETYLKKYETAEEQVERLFSEICARNSCEFIVRGKCIYFKKNAPGKLQLGPLGYSENVAQLWESGKNRVGLYQWKDNARAVVTSSSTAAAPKYAHRGQ